jgi:hypothetical protein
MASPSTSLLRRQASCVRTALPVLAITAGIAFGAPVSAQEAAPCHVTRQVGVATLMHGSSSVPATVGAPVSAGDRIVTGEGGRVELTCGDGSVIVLGERTNASLAIFQIEGDRPLKRLLRLIGGILRLNAPASGAEDRFEVMTDTAVASVRSTHWIVDAKPDTTGVFVQEGRVAVTSLDVPASVILDPGFGTDVARGAAPTTPKRWGQARIDDVLARTALP